MLSLNHYPHSLRLKYVLYCLCDLGGKLLLNLQSARKSMHNAREFGNPHDPKPCRQIADMRAPDDRQHMMLTKADHPNILQHHQLIISTDFLECAFEILTRID